LSVEEFHNAGAFAHDLGRHAAKTAAGTATTASATAETATATAATAETATATAAAAETATVAETTAVTETAAKSSAALIRETAKIVAAETVPLVLAASAATSIKTHAW